jgi:hypothetical protein
MCGCEHFYCPAKEEASQLWVGMCEDGETTCQLAWMDKGRVGKFVDFQIIEGENRCWLYQDHLKCDNGIEDLYFA